MRVSSGSVSPVCVGLLSLLSVRVCLVDGEDGAGRVALRSRSAFRSFVLASLGADAHLSQSVFRTYFHTTQAEDSSTRG